LLLASHPALADPSEDQLLQIRRAWWKSPGHALEVDELAPLETVRGVAHPKALPGATGGIAPDAVQAALRYVQRGRTQSFLIWYKGALRLEYYGPGFGPASRSAPASMPKPVLALAVGAAVDRGLMTLDSPVSRWLPQWKDDPRGAITVRDLLQMRSGLAKDGPASGGGRGEALMIGTRLADLVLATPLAAAPGSRFDYNNVDNALLALVLEKATGERYAQWLSHTIWHPLGAGDANIWIDRPGGLARTFCCVLTTARDWIRVGRLIAGHGSVDGHRVLSSGWMESMLSPSPTNPNYGFQIWRASPYAPLRSYGSGIAKPMPASVPFLADDMVYFDGAIGQRLYVSPSRDLMILRVGDSILDWDDAALPNMIVAGLR
jgi:CubicO group peptidase (beta-lactamase class C family)